MFTVRRKAVQSVKRLGTRQYSAAHGAEAHGGDHGHHHEAHEGPGTESFGVSKPPHQLSKF